MFYAKKYNLKPGDQIVECITALGITKHFALYLGPDEYNREWIVENKKITGVRLIPAAKYFSQLISLARIEKFIGTNAERNQAVKNALKSVGKPYHLTDYNCEHFVTEVTTGKSESKQVQNVSLSILGLLLFGMLAD